MAYATRYRIEARSTIGTLWHVSIEEDGYTGPITSFSGSGTPIRIKYTDNDEKKVSAIRASACVIEFISDTFDLDDIINDNDTKYRVSLNRINTDLSETLQWRGFLSTDDCQEQYTSGARAFSLTATDALGLLKDEDYKWQDGTTGKDAYGKRSLLQIIADCLQYTYTELDISIQCNVYEEVIAEFLEVPPFLYNKAHTKLFLYADNGPKNMYDVLECIMLSFDCTLFQQFGQWHINRMPDYYYAPATNNTTTYSWSDLSYSQGTQTWLASRFTHFIPINAGHLQARVKPNGYSKITHNYIIPETPENERMARGAYISGTPGASALVTYEIDFWKLEYGTVSSPSTGDVYREEAYDAEGNLLETYTVLNDQGTTDERILPVEGIWADAGDSITITFDTRSSTDESGSGSGVGMRLMLFGDSGQKYTWNQSLNTWDATLAGALGAIGLQVDLSLYGDTTKWFSLSVETTGFPESGILEPWFTDWSAISSYIHIRNINIEPKLLLNGVTANFKGEYSRTDNNLTSRNSNEVTIRLGDSPKRLVASGLWRGSDDTQLTNGWGRLGEAQTSRLIDLNSQDLQRTAYRVCKKLDGDYKGITFDDGKLLGPGNLYSISDITWIATNMEIDIINDNFSATMQEFTDVLRDTEPTLDTEFKYIFDERS